MAWIFLCKSQGCSGTYRDVFPHRKIVDALKAFDRKNELDADVLQWSEISLKDAKALGRRLGKDLIGYEWAK